MNTFRLISPPRMLLDIDADIRTLLKGLGDFVPHSGSRAFLAQVVSTLLSSLVIEDTAEAFDGFERLLYQVDVGPTRHLGSHQVMEVMWGHYTQILHLYFRRYHRSQTLVDDLKDLISPDDRSSAEELFDVSLDQDLRFIAIR